MVNWTGEISDSGFFGSERGDGAEALDPAVVDLVDELSTHAPPGREGLIRVLLGLQQRFARVSWRVQELVAERFGLSPAQVAGIVSFYPRLNAERQGRREIDVCNGSGCFLQGGDRILRRVEDEASARRSPIDEARFTVRQERCLGTCGLGPVVRIQDRIRPIAGEIDADDLVESVLGPKAHGGDG